MLDSQSQSQNQTMRVYVSRLLQSRTGQQYQHIELVLTEDQARHLGYPDTKVGFSIVAGGNIRVFRTQYLTSEGRLPGTGSSIRVYGTQFTVRFNLDKVVFKPTGRTPVPYEKANDGFLVKVSQAELVELPPEGIVRKREVRAKPKDSEAVPANPSQSTSAPTRVEDLRDAIETVKLFAKDLNAVLFLDENGELRARIETVI